MSDDECHTLPFALGVAKKLARLEMEKATLLQDLKITRNEIRMLKLDGRCRKIEFPVQNYCHVHDKPSPVDGYPYSDDSDYDACRCSRHVTKNCPSVASSCSDDESSCFSKAWQG